MQYIAGLLLTDDNGSGVVAWHARAESQGGNWALCYDSSTDCTACASATFNWNGYSCSCPSGSTNTFHGGCDAYTQTVVIGHNSLGFTFGGFAQATWAGNSTATEATGDFLFRLGPGATPVVYRPNGKDTDYQHRDPRYQFRNRSYWPTWASRRDPVVPCGYGPCADLSFGIYGALGQRYAGCWEGSTYAGEFIDACGPGNWGATEMEVWYRVGS